MRKFENIIQSETAPQTNSLWLHNGVLKVFNNGQWVELSGGDKTETVTEEVVYFQSNNIIHVDVDNNPISIYGETINGHFVLGENYTVIVDDRKIDCICNSDGRFFILMEQKQAEEITPYSESGNIWPTTMSVSLSDISMSMVNVTFNDTFDSYFAVNEFKIVKYETKQVTFNDQLKDYVTKEELEDKLYENAPNWNASFDEPGYIHNRPFYEEFSIAATEDMDAWTKSPVIDFDEQLVYSTRFTMRIPYIVIDETKNIIAEKTANITDDYGDCTIWYTTEDIPVSRYSAGVVMYSVRPNLLNNTNYYLVKSSWLIKISEYSLATYNLFPLESKFLPFKVITKEEYDVIMPNSNIYYFITELGGESTARPGDTVNPMT